MVRPALALLCLLLPAGSSARPYGPRPATLGEALDTRDAMAGERERLLEQAFVLPERPGQNQVAWYDFDWRYVDVPPPGGGPGGIRVYYYRSETAQLARALPAIQSAYARLVDQFRYSPTQRIPYILFATQREFQTQNVFQVTESVLGVTSPADLKMSVPYFGDHARFTEVSTHEMVHQFTIQKLLDAAGTDEMSSPVLYLPLWFIEGIAEYYTQGGIDTETDRFLRDLVANPEPRKGYEVLPFAEDRIRGYIPTYKLGQARIAFIADVYGREKIQAFLENAYLLAGSGRPDGSSTRGFGALVRRVLNEPLEQVDGRWQAWMKRRYYAAYLESRQDLPLLRELRGLGFEPEDFAASPDGSVVAVRGIDRRRGRARLYLLDVANPKGAVEIASDNQPGSESLHPIEHSVATVGARVVVFAAQDGIGDTVYLRTYRRTEEKGRPPRVSTGRRRTLDVRPPGGDRFIQVIDPALSPDEKELAFVGVARDGQRDVYTVPIRGGLAKRLTDDPYAERDVAWGRDGLYYASDATDHGRTNLFRLDPGTGTRTRLTTAPTSDRHPAPAEDGKVYFSSEAAGKSDLYVLENGAVRRLTDFTTGLTSPALAQQGRGLLASTFHGGAFRLVEVPKLAYVSDPPVPVAPAVGDVLGIPEAQLPAAQSDYAAFAASNWRPDGVIVYGGAGGGSVAGRAAALFSDTLRDHSVFVDVSVYGSFDYTQGILIYENRAGRIGWITGAFHFVQLNIDRVEPDLVYLQRDFGVVGALRYPFDRFRRVDFELTLAGVQRRCPANFAGQTTLICGILMTDPNNPLGPPVADSARQTAWEERNGGLHLNLQPAVRFGYDTIRYDRITGPLGGRSLVAELGGGWLPGPGAVHGFAKLDTQLYLQLVGRANLGLRLAAGTTFSSGETSRNWARTWWLTSADNLRGFNPFDTEFLTGRHYWVANLELQFPLDPILRLALFDFVEGVAALDFGGVFDRWETRPPPANPVGRPDVGPWDARTLTGVLGVNVLLGPLLLRVHFGHPFDVGGIETPALAAGDRWVTNLSLRYAFF